MGEDEEGTHERLKAHLQELVEPKIAEHRGRTVKNTGDGFLAEFPSVDGWPPNSPNALRTEMTAYSESRMRSATRSR
jgi:class 3 adenylate cyclase